jgi:hypothetical protein
LRPVDKSFVFSGGKFQVDASYIRVNEGRSIGNFRFLPVFGGIFRASTSFSAGQISKSCDTKGIAPQVIVVLLHTVLEFAPNVTKGVGQDSGIVPKVI